MQFLLTCFVMVGLAGAIATGTMAKAGVGQAMPALGATDFRPSDERPTGWRGDGSGQYVAADPATKWSDKENVLWKSEVGTGHSSPIVVGRRVFVTAETNLLLCLDSDTGKELWHQSHQPSDLPANNEKWLRYSSQYGDTTPTPVSDGKFVWVFTGTGIVACYDLEGTCRWSHWFDFRPNTGYGRTASPVLVGGRLLVHFGPLVCLDAATGKVLWKNDSAKATYGTPAPARLGTVDVVITPKGKVVRVADGKTLASDLGNCMYTSPVVQGRVAYFIDSTMTAVELPEQAADAIECKELWATDLTGDFYASPLILEGRIYTVDKAAKYYVVDANIGKVLLDKRLELGRTSRTENANVYPSLCLAGKYLFVGNDAGETVVLKPGDEGAMVGSNCLPRGSGGTPAFSGQRMFVRSGKLLYCVAGGAGGL